MTAAVHPQLTPGRVYRTKELASWSANPPRLARRLVREGVLTELGRGLYVHPQRSRWGEVPPADHELMRAFLEGSPFVFTGPDQWNALGLGTTAMFAVPLVYNTRRTGMFVLGGRRFLLRRVAFPPDPPPEWFVIDLLEHADEAGASRDALAAALAQAVGRFDRVMLAEMARRFGSVWTREVVRQVVEP